MKALEILKRCRDAKGELERLQQRIAQRRDILDAKAPQADPNGGSRGSGDKDKIGRVTADIVDLEREMEARKEELMAEQTSACALLDMVPDLESEVLHMYYVKNEDTARIARRKKYTNGYVRRVKRNAEQLLDMLDEERVNATLPSWYLKREGGE